MNARAEPISMLCEGSGCPVNRGSTCQMCGLVVPTWEGRARMHERKDIVAMIRRGDFDAETAAGTETAREEHE